MAKLGKDCTEACNHIAPGCGWPHETMAAEDRGNEHTDDCGHFSGECCTSGQPGVLCRVGTTERQRELKKFQRLVARNRAAKRRQVMASETMLKSREQHFVTFYSPGTFVSEETTKPIASWDRKLACEMARHVVERHGAKPYGFRFSTSLVADPVDDGRGGKLEVKPKQIAQSPMHFFSGHLLTLLEVEREFGADSILVDNMRFNKLATVVRTRGIDGNGYVSTMPFSLADGDCIVGHDGRILVGP